ncbi:hypothetical protein FHS23_003125 [Prauserella isguenensis]|uniref:DUF222 domain-containing protein n=1 Tax=Prauserella isguenensis TaxID=1470180 RepID=A0A839S2X2_9PSEU|nr:HNH endonuclease signature motif containing protein [Prauserella isguenensis]MBB3052096.1 hypothetical protein [Prauserella isguenensis]
MGERDELIRDLRTARAERARADAAEMTALARLAELEGDVRSLADEVAPELRVSAAEASRRIGRATALAQRLPTVHGWMHAGQLEAYGARRLVDVTAPLGNEHARRVDALLGQRLAADPTGSWAPVNLARRARRLVEHVDPHGQAVRARTARNKRGVELQPREHAMSRLAVDLPADVGTAVKSHLDALARRLRGRNREDGGAGDGRTMDQLRADVAADLLLGRDPGATVPKAAATVHVHLPVDTALAITDDGCELDGYGPIPGPVAREIMTNPHSTWRAVLCDPGSGRPVDLGRTRRRPTATVRELVAVRDRECCIPWCHRPARHCDFDHNTPWADGGDTSTVNGSPKCDHHHARKNHPGWRIRHDTETGVTAVTTPNGAVHTTATEPIHHPTRRRPTRSGGARRAPQAVLKRPHPRTEPGAADAETPAIRPLASQAEHGAPGGRSAGEWAGWTA